MTPEPRSAEMKRRARERKTAEGVNVRRIVKPRKVPASEKEFFVYACVAISTVMLTIMAFALYAKNLLGAQYGFLSALLWIFAGFYFLHRYGVRKKRTIGIITPVIVLAAVLASFWTLRLVPLAVTK